MLFKSTSRAFLRTAFYGSLMTAIAVGCSKKSSDEEGSSSPELTLDAPQFSDGKAKITYESKSGDVSYKCRVDVDGQKGEYEDCDPSGLEISYKSGSTYKVYVKVVTKGGAESQAVMKSFVAPGATAVAAAIAQLRTLITNRDQLGKYDAQNKTLSLSSEQQIVLQFGIEGSAYSAQQIGYQCKIGNNAYADCGGNSYTMQVAKDASYPLSVRAFDKASNQNAVEENLTVYGSAFVPNAGAAQPTGRAWAPSIGVGSGFAWNLSPGMHITEYSSTKNAPNTVNFFRILQGDDLGMDPFYLHVDTCNSLLMPWKYLTSRRSPFSQSPTYQYCQTTMRREDYKEENEFNLALNHIEVATDADAVSTDGNTPPAYERIAVSVFDADFEFMNTRSRFLNLCQNSWRKTAYTFPGLNRFFEWEQPTLVNFYTCEAILPNPITGAPENWRVGAFFSVRGNLGHFIGGDYGQSNWGCGCSTTTPEAVEMVYMSRTAGEFDFQFAKQAQTRILQSLVRTQPN